MTDSDNGPSPAPLVLESITCRGFRGLDEVTLTFHPKLTVLVGRNNSGKSRLLRAVALAVNALPADKDDLTVDGAERAEIDVVVAPAPTGGDESFDARLGALLAAPARQTISEAPLRERVSWRTTIETSAEGLAARATRTVRQWNAAEGDWSEPQGEIHAGVIALIRAHLVETGRDLAAELRRRGTAANRLVNDLEIDPDARGDLQGKLDELSASIVEGSRTLTDVGESLVALADQVDAIGQPSVRPMPGRVDDLSTVATVELTDHEGSSLPLHLHGTGARSMTSLRLQGLLYERRLGADGGDLRPHAITLIEEPEAHLHPQAQFDLPGVFQTIPGQVVVSTHSTHLVSEVEPEHLRILGTDPAELRIVTLEPVDEPDDTTPRQLTPRLYRDEMEKLRRTVERPFGEILFASAIVIGDGATERALLPVVLRRALGRSGCGVCVVDPGSMNSPATIAVVKAAELLGIPWFLFADDDEAGQEAVSALLDQVTKEEDRAEVERERVTRIVGTATEGMLVAFDPEVCRSALEVVRPGETFDSDDEIVAALKKSKGSSGRLLGGALVETYPDPDTWPQPLQDLVGRLRDRLGTDTAGHARPEDADHD